MENEPKENLADNFEHRPNEAATRNDLLTLATLVDRLYNKVDFQFQTIQTIIKEEQIQYREAMRKEMFRFAGFLTLSGLTALGIFAAAFR